MTEQDQVSQEQETQTAPEATNAFGLPEDHPAVKEIRKVRSEAASTRDKKNKAEAELQEKAKKWEEYELSQKSELEQATERAAALESKLRDLETKELRQAIADEFKLDADLRDMLSGDADQMKSMAKTLSEKLAASQKVETSTDLFLGGDRGKAVTGRGDKSPGAAWLESYK